MKLFCITPKIAQYSSVREFLDQFNFQTTDLIFTNRLLDREFFKQIPDEIPRLYQEDYFTGEPSDSAIDLIISEAQKIHHHRVIAIGGGSVIDPAKLLCLKPISDTISLFERKVPLVKEKELIAIPTTCRTGSEVTNISIAEIKAKGTKMGLADDTLFPDQAILIPELLNLLPYEFFLYSSLDALIHACESYLSPKASAFSEVFSLKAIEKILIGYREIIQNGTSFRFRLSEDFLVASCYAGIAFGNAGVGAVHAMSYPLSGKYHVPHGEANYQFFTAVFQTYEAKNPGGKIRLLIDQIRSVLHFDANKPCFESLTDFLALLIKTTPLHRYGMTNDEIVSFSKRVTETQQRLLANNYVELSEREITKLYALKFEEQELY